MRGTQGVNGKDSKVREGKGPRLDGHERENRRRIAE
jgi:hypothetical protein